MVYVDYQEDRVIPENVEFLENQGMPSVGSMS